MAVFKRRRMVVGLKLETTEGTAIAVAGADANFFAENVTFSPDISMDPQNPVSGDQRVLPDVPGMQIAKATFEYKCRASGTAGTAPALGKILKLARMAETIVAVTSATYDPIAVGDPSATVDFYDVPESGNNIKQSMRGARVSSLKCDGGQNGKPLVFHVELTGVYNGTTDAAGITATGLETTQPPGVLSAAFAVQSLSAKISQFAIDFGITGVIRSDVSKAEGAFSYVNTEMSPVLTFDAEKELVATHDFYGKLIAGTLGAFTVTIGGTAGNICTITGPKAQYVDCKPGERNGLSVFNITAKLTDNAGNDRIKLAFT